MLAADADLEAGPRLAPALGADTHQLADAVPIDGHEGIDLEDAAAWYSWRGSAPHRRGDSPRQVWVRSLVPNEKNSAPASPAAISSALSAARGSSIMVPIW